MKKTLLFIFISISVNSLFAQMSSDTLNGYNPKDKKIGFWKVYLTDYLVETADSSEAYYYAYDYYINGRLVIWTSAAQYYKKKALNVVRDNPLPQKGNPTLLTGNFKFYFKDGIGLDETYANGLPILTATCIPTFGDEFVKTEIVDFSKPYNNQFGSFFYERYNVSGELTYSRFYVPDENGKLLIIKSEE